MRTRGVVEAVEKICGGLLPEPLDKLCTVFAKAEMAADSLKGVIEEPSSKVSLRGEAERSVKADSPSAIVQDLPQVPPALGGGLGNAFSLDSVLGKGH
jgi:hypothetical protein